jgi:hypothetical protein
MQESVPFSPTCQNFENKLAKTCPDQGLGSGKCFDSSRQKTTKKHGIRKQNKNGVLHKGNTPFGLTI